MFNMELALAMVVPPPPESVTVTFTVYGLPANVPARGAPEIVQVDAPGAVSAITSPAGSPVAMQFVKGCVPPVLTTTKLKARSSTPSPKANGVTEIPGVTWKEEVPVAMLGVVAAEAVSVTLTVTFCMGKVTVGVPEIKQVEGLFWAMERPLGNPATGTVTTQFIAPVKGRFPPVVEMVCGG